MLTNAQEKALREYVRQTPPSDVARGMMLTDGAKPGPYRLLPLMGYIGKRGETPYLIVQGLLLRTFDDRQVGMLSWTIPLTDATQPAALDLLVGLGWDGRLWPNDAGWPDGDPREAEGLRKLLRECRLDASLVFPPVEGLGCRTIRVLVAKKGGEPFPMPPALSEEDRVEVGPGLADKFAALVADPSVFPETAPTAIPSRFQFTQS